jgi:hypothetical protein
MEALRAEAGRLIMAGWGEWLPGRAGFEDLARALPQGTKKMDCAAVERFFGARIDEGWTALCEGGLFFIAWGQKAERYRARRAIWRRDLEKVDLYTFGESVMVTVTTKGKLDSFQLAKGRKVDRDATVRLFVGLRKMLKTEL